MFQEQLFELRSVLGSSGFAFEVFVEQWQRVVFEVQNGDVSSGNPGSFRGDADQWMGAIGIGYTF